mmetsp:Transcript_2991/g.8398  ORF Transcript_2991/g.8398 Transcript_2991/m.8398 type:complete len:99 (-) Transcript_2991:166-462(-)
MHRRSASASLAAQRKSQNNNTTTRCCLTGVRTGLKGNSGLNGFLGTSSLFHSHTLAQTCNDTTITAKTHQLVSRVALLMCAQSQGWLVLQATIQKQIP